jgi:hypothetical protein
MAHVQAAPHSKLLQPVNHRNRRISRRGEQLENAQLSVPKTDAVSERTAGIDGYAQSGLLS